MPAPPPDDAALLEVLDVAGCPASSSQEAVPICCAIWGHAAWHWEPTGVVGAQGVLAVLEPELDGEERKKLDHSIDVLRHAAERLRRAAGA